jgi:5-formyltetrahydrofolate cyclo-ligase
VPDFPAEAEKSRAAKATLRDQLLTKRRSLSGAVRAAAAARVQAATIDLVRHQNPSTTAAYVPVGPEPGGPGLPEALAGALTALRLPPSAQPARLLLPVLRPDRDLDWAVHGGPGTLAPAPRGLREPVGPRTGPDAVRTADLLIVPALAVDRTGLRMGRGGGSYDRALARATRAFVVALLHDGELLDAVPAEPHDLPVHAVITPGYGLVVLRER